MLQVDVEKETCFGGKGVLVLGPNGTRFAGHHFRAKKVSISRGGMHSQASYWL
jgi:hypothetical protein